MRSLLVLAFAAIPVFGLVYYIEAERDCHGDLVRKANGFYTCIEDGK